MHQGNDKDQNLFIWTLYCRKHSLCKEAYLLQFNFSIFTRLTQTVKKLIFSWTLKKLGRSNRSPCSTLWWTIRFVSLYIFMNIMILKQQQRKKNTARLSQDPNRVWWFAYSELHLALHWRKSSSNEKRD